MIAQDDVICVPKMVEIGTIKHPKSAKPTTRSLAANPICSAAADALSVCEGGRPGRERCILCSAALSIPPAGLGPLVHPVPPAFSWPPTPLPQGPLAPLPSQHSQSCSFKPNCGFIGIPSPAWNSVEVSRGWFWADEAVW